MKAIWTKYLGPTNFRGSRIRASAEGATILVGYDDALSSGKAHDAAAVALVRKMGWPGTLVRGGRPDGAGYVYVFASDRESIETGVPSYAEQAAMRARVAESVAGA